MSEQIESESKFLWKFLLKILLTPVTFFLVLIGKKQFGELNEPFRMLFRFFFEAKVTAGLIIVNISIFIATLFIGENFVMAFASYPQDMLSLRAYTLITSGFLHSGLAHLFGNMLALLIFGRVVERKLGSGRMALVYFGALLISGIFSSLIDLFITGSRIPGVGASGAIMGLIAAAILLNPFYITYELIFPLPIMLVGWLTIYADITGIINPTDDGIGHFAHLGGFLSVALLVFILHQEDRASMKKGLIINLVSLAVFAAAYFLFLS